MNNKQESAIQVTLDGPLGIVELTRTPHNYFDFEMIAAIADAWEQLESDKSCRVIILCAQGKSFCAGADFSRRENTEKKRSARQINPLYLEAIRLFSCSKPVVAAVHGAAVGGGLGLALTADFRVTCKEAKFSANFNRLGFHPGFGLTFTLPRLVGQQKASWLFYSGTRIDGEEAVHLGLADFLVSQEDVREKAFEVARQIAVSSPRAVQSTRATLRHGLLEQLRNAVARESAEQAGQMTSDDLREGVAAMAERRDPNFAD